MLDTSDDLIGLAEIATLLGVSRQKADQLTGTSSFPVPAITMAGSRVWERTNIEAWARELGRIEVSDERDEANRVRFADRNFPVRAGDVLVPTTAVEGPKCEPDLEWIRYETAIADGAGFGGLPIKIVPLQIWNSHINHLGGLK